MRPLGEGDEALYCRLYSDPIQMRHIAPAMTGGAARRSFGIALRQQGDKRCVWVITAPDTATEFGILGVVPDGVEAEIGVMLFVESQARGIATEVIPAAADALFRAPTLVRLWTRHAAANGPAAALMRNLAFERLAGAGVPVGEWRWQLTRERWSCNGAPMATSGAIG